MTFHSSFLVKESSELIFIQLAWMNGEGFFMDKQMFCLTWDFKFDHSGEMDKKY